MSQKNSRLENWKNFFLTSTWAGALLALFVLIIASAISSEAFLYSQNINSLIRNLAFISLVALGQALMLVVGELNLAVGATGALAGVISGVLMVWFDANAYLSFLLAIIMAAILGLFIGLLVTKLKLNSLVVTIGAMGIFEGLNLIITKGRAITGIPMEINFLGRGEIFGFLPIPFVIMLLLMVVIVFIAKFTRYGRYIYAIGDNKNTAEILGINVDRVIIITFIISSSLAALAGILMMARLGSSQPGIGETWVLDSIAAAVIGGVALSGGVGNPAGAVIGAGIMAIISNIIVINGVSTYWQSAVSGLVVIVAISIDSIRRIFKERQKLKE